MKKFLYFSLVVSLLLAAPLIMAQNVPSLPGLGGGDKKAEMPELPKLPEMGKPAELPKINDIAQQQIAEKTPEQLAEEKRKAEELAAQQLQIPEVPSTIVPPAMGVETTSKGEIAPEVDLPQINSSIKPYAPQAAPTQPVDNLSTLDPLAAPAPVAQPTVPSIKQEAIDAQARIGEKINEMQQAVPDSAPVEQLTTVPQLAAAPSPDATINTTTENNIEPSVKLAPTGSELPKLSAENEKQQNIKSVLDDVFGEKKEEPKVEEIKVEQVKNSEEKITEKAQAEEIIDEKVITTEEVQALEASTYETDALDSKDTKEAYKPKPQNVTFKPIDFKSQTYTDAQLGSQLFQESMRGNKENVVAIINSGVNINTANENLQTPLMGAAFSGNDEMIGFLLSQGAQVNIKDKNGNTALHVATSKNNVRAVQRLISAGAQIDARNNSNDTPLLIAINNKNISLVQTLVANGANVNLANSEGLTPLHMAAYSGDINLVQSLIAKGADKSATTRQGLRPYDIALNRNPQIASVLLPNGEVHQQKLADASSQLSMFPKEYSEEKIEEPKSETSGWWGEKFFGNEEKPKSQTNKSQTNNVQPVQQLASAPVAPVETYAADSLEPIQQPAYQNISTPQTIELQPVASLEANNSNLTPVPASLRLAGLNSQAAQVQAQNQPQIQKAVEQTIAKNTVPNVNAANAPTTPVQGLTKVSYESGRTYTEIAPARIVPAASVSNEVSGAQYISTPAPQAVPQKNISVNTYQAPTYSNENQNTNQNTNQNSGGSVVPMSLRLNGAKPNEVRAINIPIAEPVFVGKSQVAAAPVQQVMEESSDNLVQLAPQEMVQQPTNAQPISQQPVVQQPASKQYAAQQYVSPQINQESVPVKTSAAPTQPVAPTQNAASASLPTRNLNKVDYVGFYNNKASATPSSSSNAVQQTNSAAAKSSGVLQQSYATLSADEKAKWDSRMSQWLQSKKSGTASPEMLTKQERILRVIYKEQFNAAVSRSNI
jgi:ankyrin repeat protein